MTNARRPPGKNDSLEALDFIISVLKEHEKDLDRLIGELGRITSKIGAGGEINTKVERVEQRLETIQGEVANLIKELSTPKEAGAGTAVAGNVNLSLRGPPVIVRCKQWDDFKTLAQGAETVSFLMKEPEKSFQADALKNGRVLTYNGEYPRDAKLLKLWIAHELTVEEEKVFEGVLAIG